MWAILWFLLEWVSVWNELVLMFYVRLLSLISIRDLVFGYFWKTLQHILQFYENCISLTINFTCFSLVSEFLHSPRLGTFLPIMRRSTVLVFILFSRIDQAKHWVMNLTSQGGTNLLGALKHIYKINGIQTILLIVGNQWVLLPALALALALALL